MNMLTVKLDFPRNILGVLDIPERQLGNRLRELIVLELVREARISSGKGAEMTGMGKKRFYPSDGPKRYFLFYGNA